jgi:uncharacterized membrane protein
MGINFSHWIHISSINKIMKPTTIISLKRPTDYIRLALWLFLIIFAGRFIIKDALPYFGIHEEVFRRFWGVRWWLVGHITGGVLALTLGPFQFWQGFRNKYLKIHRWFGKVYIISILIASICSTYLAWTSALAVHWTWSVGLQGLALAWIVTVLMAYRSIMKRRIQIHKEWMIRSYVVTFAFRPSGGWSIFLLKYRWGISLNVGLRWVGFPGPYPC